MKNFDTKEIFAVWTNIDLTEGRGNEYVRAFCELESTAKRYAKGAYVMGTDCRITKETFLKLGTEKVNAVWYAPHGLSMLADATKEDIKLEEKLKAEREANMRREKVLDKARALGLTDTDIATLRT
jgi:hypothetical protein